MSGQIPAGRFSNKNAKTQKKARLNAEEDELRLQLRLLARTSNNAAFSQIIQNLFKAETYYQKQLKYYYHF